VAKTLALRLINSHGIREPQWKLRSIVMTQIHIHSETFIVQLAL
jgi:hypothetical protein